MCINNPYLAFEDGFAHRNLYHRDSVLREKVQHIQITALHADVANPSGDLHLGSRFEQFGVSDKRVSWISPALLFAHPYLPRTEVMLRSTSLLVPHRHSVNDP